MHRLGFVGFGEAAYYLTTDLTPGAAEVSAYDVATRQESPRGAQIRARAAENHVTLVESLEELFVRSELVFCLTSANSALPIARQIAPYLTQGKLYLDMNSLAPATKAAIDEALSDAEGDFVEASVMGAVPANRTHVPILVCGAKAALAAQIANECGMNICVIEGRVGSASAVKMIKSVLFKGFIALLTETVFAAERYGITQRTLDALKSILTVEMTFEEACNYFLCTMATHSERLTQEMEQVLETLNSMGENAIMTRATIEKMRWMTQQGYCKRFPLRLESYKDIIAYRDELEQQAGVRETDQ